MITLILSLLVNISHAQDHWLCTEESSQLQGNSIYACGIGLAATEAEARNEALKHATDEFNHLCDMSDTCKGHALNVDPRRTTCEQFEKQVRCYRGVLFTPKQELSKDETTRVIEVAKGQIKAEAKAKPKKHPVIRIGMTKDELLTELGTPMRVIPGGWGTSTAYLFVKTTPGCNGYFNCQVLLDDGKVSGYDPDWKVDYTDALSR